MLLFPSTFGHGSFGFNAQLDAAGAMVQANVQNTVTIDKRKYDPTFREGRDAYHLATGGALGRAHRGFGLLRLNGRILVPQTTQVASLADKEAAMRAAFDPELCYYDSPTTDGAYAFDFTELTTDTATYGTGGPGGMGRRNMRYYCRPMAQPTIEETLSPTMLEYALGLIVADPRAYEQTEQTISLTPGSPTQSLVNRGNVPSPIKLTITMTGAGASNFTITRGGVSFVLNLSTAVNGNVIVVVMETCGPYGRGRLITKAGVETFSLKTSSPATWLNGPVGSTSFTITNTTNVTSCVVGWYSARA